MSRISCSIIITNWNGKELLRECLPTVIRAVEADAKNYYEVIVVDDCSSDDSVDFLKKNFPEVTVLVPEKNLGFHKANNFGVKKAKYDIVMLLNSDIKLDETSLPSLLEHFKEEDVFAVSGKVYDWDNKFLYGNRGGKFEKGHFSLYEKKEDDSSQTMFACGGAGMFDKEKYLTLGGFDTLYRPFYYEEIDLSYRALKKGWKVIYEPSSRVYHKVSQTVSKKYQQKQVKYISGRNNYLFVWKNISSFKMILAYIFFIPLFLIRDLFRLKFRFWECFFGAILRIPLVIQRKIADLRVPNVRSDQEVFELVNKGKYFLPLFGGK